jgi:predicted ATPase
MLELAEKQDDDAPRLIARRLSGVSNFAVGKFGAARRDLDLALSLYRPSEHRNLVHGFGLEPGITTQCFQYIVCWLLGFPDQADGHAKEATRGADQSRHANTAANTSFLLSAFAMCTRDDTLLEWNAHRLKTLSKENDIVLFQSFANIALGILRALQGHESGTDQFQTGFGTNMAMGVKLFLPHYVIHHGRSLLGLRNIAAARKQVMLAHELLLETGERWAESEIHRLDADVRLAEGNPVAAVASYQNAIKIAQQQEAKSLELRATVNLARHWANSGDRQKAGDLLSPIYGWFTEGVDTPDLKEAKHLLDLVG